jgi:hypothetical protein
VRLAPGAQQVVGLQGAVDVVARSTTVGHGFPAV